MLSNSFATVALALGSNLGDREQLLKQAVEQLERAVGRIVAISTFIPTAPFGFSSPHPFLNGALIIKTSLTATELLYETQRIEQHLGRTRKHRPHEAYQDRPIDIDILLYNNACISIEGNNALTVPHPEMHKRLFVLEPLCSICPLTIHPILKKTIQQLTRQLNNSLSNE